jgi:signal transduction histidine kinase/ActR/RegA family two-component response regulator
MSSQPLDREFLRTDARIVGLISVLLTLRQMAFIGADLMAHDGTLTWRMGMALYRLPGLAAYIAMGLIAWRARDRRAFERGLMVSLALALLGGSLWRAFEPAGFGVYFDTVTVAVAYVIFPLSARRLAAVLVPFSLLAVTMLASWMGLQGWDLAGYTIAMATVNGIGVALAGYRMRLVAGMRQARLAQLEVIVPLEQEVAARQSAQRQLEDERRVLEQLVRERTAELEAANASLTAALRAKDSFLATMSHELRTPLTAILGLSQHLQEEPARRSSADGEEDLATIQSSGRHLLALIDDVLTIAQVDGGHRVLIPARIPLAAFGREALRVIAPLAAQCGVTVQGQLPDEADTVDCDERTLVQLVTNLLSNAVKFTPAGGTVTLRIAPSDDRAALHISVTDTGIGIAEADLARILKPFEQLDQRHSRERGGTGLGLAIVSRLVDALGGRMDIASTPGQGSRFTLQLPVPVRADRAQPVAARATAPASPAAHRPRVLVVEDSAPLQRLLVGMLRQGGYEPQVAEHGAEALARCAVALPDVILMDVQMPVMDGLEATRRLRASPATAPVPIVVLSALAFPGDAQRALDAGADRYLTKPATREALFAALEDVLASSR